MAQLQQSSGNSTEDAIVASALTDGGTSDTSVEDSSPASTPTSSPAQTPSGGQGSTPTGTGASNNQSGQQQQQQQPQSATQAPPRSPGDLVDRSGNVLARAGAERRVFEKADRYLRGEYTARINELEQQISAFERAGGVGQQLGLSPQEVSTGQHLMAAYKKNPVETIKYLLTQAKAQGHNIDLGGQGIDTAAVARMLDERLAPLTADREAAAQEQQRVAEIEHTYSNFIGTYPDATTHENDIAALLDADPSITPEVAYLKLQSFAFRNGLDWSQPLGPQIRARQQGAQQQQQQQQRGMPTGRGNTPRAAQMQPGTVAHEATPTRDIVRNAMLAAGYKFA